MSTVEEQANVSERHRLKDRILLPGEDFEGFTSLLAEDEELFVGGRNGKICVIDLQKLGVTDETGLKILDPMRFLKKHPTRVAVDLRGADSPEEAADTIEGLLEGRPGLYPSAKYGQKIDRVFSLDFISAHNGNPARIVGFSRNGFLLTWERQKDNAFSLVQAIDISGDLAFGQKVKVLKNGDIASCALALNRLEIIEKPTGSDRPRIKLTLQIPDERWGSKVVQTFDIVEKVEGPMVVLGDSSDDVHVVQLRENNKGIYEVVNDEILPNAAKERERQFE